VQIFASRFAQDAEDAKGEFFAGMKDTALTPALSLNGRGRTVSIVRNSKRWNTTLKILDITAIFS
jgi:hypothetical protein